MINDFHFTFLSSTCILENSFHCMGEWRQNRSHAYRMERRKRFSSYQRWPRSLNIDQSIDTSDRTATPTLLVRCPRTSLCVSRHFLALCSRTLLALWTRTLSCPEPMDTFSLCVPGHFSVCASRHFLALCTRTILALSPKTLSRYLDQDISCSVHQDISRSMPQDTSHSMSQDTSRSKGTRAMLHRHHWNQTKIFTTKVVRVTKALF